MIIYLVDALAFACILKCLQSWRSWRKHRVKALKYPPGPKGLPFVGNYFDMPPSEEWEKARQWGEQYGSLVFIQNFGTRYLFLNTYEAAVDLFEKRGHNYSSRPENVMLDLEGFTQWLPTVMPYGDELRKFRQTAHRYFQPSAVAGYAEQQTSWRIDHDVAESNDPYVEIADKGLMASVVAEGFFLVNALPWCASFHAIAKEGYKYSMAMYHEPHEMAKAIIASLVSYGPADGTAAPSITSKLIELKTAENGIIEEEDLIAKTTGVMHSAANDSRQQLAQTRNSVVFFPASVKTATSLLTFILAMVLNPEAQRRGQEEVDRVIGKDNLPTMEDRPNLPFVDALCKEAMRLFVFKLMAMLRNPKEYPEPEKFIPDRWLPAEGKKMPVDVNKITFGIGRRICPGRHFAGSAVFLGAASMLSAFNIEKALDEKGVPITPTEEYTSNFVRLSARHPKPFKCRITPRSEKTASLIRQAVESSG
ncbi:cytochrome P450 [Phellopilus nigrolimitatus]|nr:cytochrome P450 [Phellopilus nigrolimitatus]